MAIKRFLQNRFYGGYSDDRFLGIPYSFQYGKCCEIRKNPNSLTLSYKVEKDSDVVITSFVKKMVTISTTGDIIAFSSTHGEIWRKAYGTSTWVLVYTDSLNRGIIGAYEYNTNLVWFTSGHVHKIAIADIDANWAGTVTENYKTFTKGNSNFHPAIEFANKLYIGDSYNLAELDSLGTFTGNKLEIFHDEEIRDITYASDSLRLYARKSTNIDDSACYLWYGTTPAYNNRIPFDNTLIHCAITHEGNDFVIAGRRPYLYRAAGLQYVKEKRLLFVFDNEEMFIAPDAINIFDGLIVFGVGESNTTGKEASIGRGVWTYGQEDAKYNFSLNFDYPCSIDQLEITAGAFVVGESYIISSIGNTNFTLIGASANTVGLTFVATGVGTGTGKALNQNTRTLIGSVLVANGELYFSWRNGSTYGIDKINTSKYATQGEIVSLVQYSDVASKVKDVQSINIAFNKLLAGEKIDVGFRKNLDGDFVTNQLVAQYSDTADRDVCYKEYDGAIEDVGNYNFLETNIILTAGTNNLTTPELNEVNIEFDDGLEEGNFKN